MIRGDLVQKFKGYGAEAEKRMVGIVVDIENYHNKNSKTTIKKLVVYTEDGFERWIAKFCRILR